MRLLVLVSVCLPGILGQNPYYDQGAVGYPSYNPPTYNPPAYPSYSPPVYPSYNPPAYPSYNPPSYPSYSPPVYNPPPYYSPPQYYETYDTQVDYKEANGTVHCGILPTVHHPYGYEKDRVSFGQYPWQVQILDNYNNYKCAGGLISPRHVITSTYCVDSMDANVIRVRVGDWDIQTDKNYYEAYKNYELSVCKKHPYYPVPGYGYEPSASYAVVILELNADVDVDQYPHVEPLCIPEFYYLSKSYTNEYSSYSYGYGQYNSGPSMAPAPGPGDRNEEGADKDLECIVLGYQESPQEQISYQTQSSSYNPPSYGYGSSYNVPAYSYAAYENSRTPRRAKVRKVYGYTPQYSYGYGYTPQIDTWEAEYYYDACHADLGSPIFCLVEGRYEEEEYYPAYPPTYQPQYQPSYSPPQYSPPVYTPPAYNPPPYYQPSYSPPVYDAPRYKRQNPYYTPSYQPPAYSPAPTYQPTYSPAPTYQPSYSPPTYTPTYTPSYTPTYTPSYSPPVYEDYYKYPIKIAEPLNREYRRAVLYGVVQYPCQCSSQYGSPGNKITSTPIKDILPWIENIIHTPPACASYNYNYPVYY